jgi:DNA-directed RNA polymerase specialized sigma24 family protein
MAEQGKKLTKDERRAILRLRLGGLSVRVTAELRGCHYLTVHKYAPDALVERFRALFLKGS